MAMHAHTHALMNFFLRSPPKAPLRNREPEILEKWQNRLRYLLVDEYQDTNGCQYLLTQKEAEDVIDAVMQNAALRAEVVDDSNMALLDLLPDQMLVNGS